jgi:hypothetical protein
MRLFMNELQKLLPPSVFIVDATNFGNKFDTYTGLPSLTYLFEKGLIILPNRDSSDKEKNGFLIHELKYMKTAQHKDLLDALLRVDTVIRTQYYTGTHNQDFTVRRINKAKYELSKLDEDINTVFDKPDEKKRKEIISERQKEIAFKNMLDEQAKISIKKKRDY